MALLLRESTVAFNPTSDLSCSISSTRHFSSFEDLTGLFLLFSSFAGVNGQVFISNISLGSSFGWYFKVTQFELIFLGILMLQMFVLRYIEILPVNLNNLFLGDPSGRRKRREVNLPNEGGGTIRSVCQKDEISESMLKVLRKLDDGECLPFALCELSTLANRKESQRISTLKILPLEVRRLLQAIKVIAKIQKDNPEQCKEKSDLLNYFAEPILLKSKTQYSNLTMCQNRYHACPLTPDDLFHHINILKTADFLS